MTKATARSHVPARRISTPIAPPDAYVLSGALALVSAVACAFMLVFRDWFRGPEVSIGSAQGTASCSSWSPCRCSWFRCSSCGGASRPADRLAGRGRVDPLRERALSLRHALQRVLLLVMLAIETASFGVDRWMGHAADPVSSVASAVLTPVFAVLTLVGLVARGLFPRSGPRTST